MVRDRLEDIGRMMVMIEKILEHELFDQKWYTRPKDAIDQFAQLSHDKQMDIIHSLAYWIDHIEMELNEVEAIAKGYDVLNDTPKPYRDD